MIGKIKRWMKNKAGVSPIIAIILMVAITVVLAATIYVWVSGMGRTGTGGESLSAIYLTKSPGTNITFQVTGVSSSSIKWTDVTAQTVTTTGTVANATKTISDADGDGYIDAGETFTITASDGPYYFQLIYGGNVIWKSSIAYTL